MIKAILIFLSIGVLFNMCAENKKDIKKRGGDFEIVGEYTEYALTGWNWKLVVIPADTSKPELISIAMRLHKLYPLQRFNIFDDNGEIKSFIARQNYINDSSGKIKEVPYKGDWLNQHHIANINDRSFKSEDKWQLVTPYGEHIEYLN